MNSNIEEFNNKINSIFLMLEYEIIDEEKTTIFKNYIYRLKEDKQALNLMIDRNNKTFDLVKIFNNEWDDKINLLSDNNDFWINLQFIVLLHELTFDGDKQIIKKMYKKIKQKNKAKGVKVNNNEQFNLESLKDLLFNQTTNPNSENVANDLMSQIKNKFNEKEKLNATDLLTITQDLCDSYHKKIEKGDINIKDLLGGVMGMMKNPDNIKDQFKDIDSKFEGTPTDIMTAVQDKMKEKGIDTNEILKQMNLNNMDLLKNNDLSKMFSQGNNVMDLLKNNSDLINLLNPTKETPKLIECDKPIDEKKKQIDDYFNNLSL